MKNINFTDVLGTLFIAFILAFSLKSHATEIDWEAQAKAEWNEEFGEFQPNLTQETEQYLRKQAIQIQERNEVKSTESARL
ncbi:hypothetical protein [Pasteurella multocida]|uniref:hypothetical protein n=1 Tax=Pasteurella multocida TaxID=747 RepID=UPI001F534864|nr:hypothetical protein [Pasteurella multocida]